MMVSSGRQSSVRPERRSLGDSAERRTSTGILKMGDEQWDHECPSGQAVVWFERGKAIEASRIQRKWAWFLRRLCSLDLAVRPAAGHSAAGIDDVVTERLEQNFRARIPPCTDGIFHRPRSIRPNDQGAVPRI